MGPTWALAEVWHPGNSIAGKLRVGSEGQVLQPLSGPWRGARRDSRALLLGVQTPPVSGAEGSGALIKASPSPPAATTLAVALGPPNISPTQSRSQPGGQKRRSLRLAEAQVPRQLWKPRLKPCALDLLCLSVRNVGTSTFGRRLRTQAPGQALLEGSG